MKIFRKNTSQLFLRFIFIASFAIAVFYQVNVHRTDLTHSQGGHTGSNEKHDSLSGFKRAEQTVSILPALEITRLDDVLGRSMVIQETETALVDFSHAKPKNQVNHSVSGSDLNDLDEETFIQDKITIKVQLTTWEKAPPLLPTYESELDKLDVNEMVDLIDKQTHLLSPAEKVPEVSLREPVEDFDEELFIEEVILDVVTQGRGLTQHVESVISGDLTILNMDKIEREAESLSQGEVSFSEVPAVSQTDINPEEVLFIEEIPVPHFPRQKRVK